MITEQQRAVLADVFENTEALDKVSLSLDETTRTVTIIYEDADDEWFRELRAAGVLP